MLTRHSLLLIPSTILMLVPQSATAQLVTELAPSPDKPSAQVDFVVASPDGTILVTVGDDAAFWHKDETTPFLSLPTKASNYSPGFSGDGRRFVYAGVDEQNQYAAIVVDVAGKQVSNRIRWSGYYMALNGDGSELALSSEDGIVIHNVQTGEQAGKISLPEDALAIAYSPDGERLAIAVRSEKDQIQIFDAKTRTRLATSKSFAPSQPTRLFFATDSKTLLSVHDGLLMAWNPQTGAKRSDVASKLQTPDWIEEPENFALSPSGKMVASICSISGSRSPCLVISDVQDGKMRYAMPIAESSESIAFAGNDFILVASGNSSAQRWNLPLLSQFQDTPLASMGIRGPSQWDDATANSRTYRKVAFSPDSSTVALLHAGPLVGKEVQGADDHTIARHVTLIDVKSGKVSSVLSPQTLERGKELCDLAYTPDGYLLIAGYQFVGRWTASTKKYADLLKVKNCHFVRLALDAAGKKCFIATESYSGSHHEIFALNAGALTPLGKYATRIRPGFAASPDGTKIARGLELLNAQTGEEIQAANSSEDLFDPNTTVFTSDGHRLVVYDVAEAVVVWELESNEITRPLPLFKQDGAFALSADSKRIATGQKDGLVRLWDLDKRTVLVTFRGHKDAIVGLCFSPDGTKIASVSADRTVKIWDASSYKANSSP